MPTGTVVSRGYLATVDGVHGRVRATFDRCAHITVECGPALVLHAGGRDHTPTSVCTTNWPPAGSTISVGDPVVGRAGHLKIGELVLDARGARAWRPARPSVPMTTLAVPGTLDRPELRAAARRTGELLPALERALTRRDAGRVADFAGSLIGRGPGLTPSGDDALVGLLAALHRLAPAGDRSLELLAPAVAARLHRTGDISAHYLRLALAGHVGERLIGLCDALAAGQCDAIETATAAVIATGATSGADALLGVLAGVRLIAARGAGERAAAA